MPRTAQFTGLNDWIEVFKAGTHTDSKGRSATFTEADLDEMVANVAHGAPPAVLGHPKHNDPAYGWARDVRRDGDTLLAKFSDVNPAFQAGVDSGAYRNRSVSVFNDPDRGWLLRHIGWLGAAPPAIPGLAELQYAAADDVDAFEFAMTDVNVGTAAYALGSVGDLLRSLRDYVISKDGLDVADRVLPDWQISSIATAASTLRDVAYPSDSNPTYTNPMEGSMNFTQKQLDEAAERARVETEARLTAQFTAQTTQLQTLQTERLNERIAVQINAWKAGGQVLPAEEPGLAEFMASLEGGAGGEFNFTAADNTAHTATPSKFFHDFVGRRAALVKLGKPVAGDPLPTNGLDLTDANAIARAASEFQAAESKAGREISIDVAVANVTRKATKAA